MSENEQSHTLDELKTMQKLDLDSKIQITQMKDWNLGGLGMKNVLEYIDVKIE